MSCYCLLCILLGKLWRMVRDGLLLCFADIWKFSFQSLIYCYCFVISDTWGLTRKFFISSAYVKCLTLITKYNWTVWVLRQSGPTHSEYLGPVVQSIVSLTSSLRVISLTVLVDSIYNILIFFAEKMWVAFAVQKLLTFFQQKISAYLRITRCKF